jgi:hypothetical protein
MPSPPRRWKNKRRSQRLILRVPVVAYQAQSPGQSLSEETYTLVISAHGALINLENKISPYESVLLKHAISGEEQECRVVYTRGSSIIGPTGPTPGKRDFRNVGFKPAVTVVIPQRRGEGSPCH